MVFDIHCHLGVDRVFGGEITEEQVLTMFKEHGITGALVQPNFVTPTIPAQAEAHDRVAAFIKAHPEYDLYGMASLNPHHPYEDYLAEVRRCVEELGFVALKLHPIAHGCDPLMPDGIHPFMAAKEFGIPLMIHTGFGSPLADPSHLLPRAKEFPEVKVIMAHLGIADGVSEALAVLDAVPSMVADLSLVANFMLPAITNTVSPDRLMFGSDVNANCAMEMAKIKHWVKDEEALDYIFGDTARAVLGIK